MKYLTLQEIAKTFQVSERLIRELADSGTLPSMRLAPRVIRFDISAVVNALNATGGLPPTGSKTEQQSTELV